jgi:hypothetical protein
MVGCSARHHCGLAVDLAFRARRLLAVAENNRAINRRAHQSSADIRDRMRGLLAEIIKYQSDPAYLEAHANSSMR